MTQLASRLDAAEVAANVAGRIHRPRRRRNRLLQDKGWNSLGAFDALERGGP